MIRVAVIGSTGQLGSDLVELLGKTGDYQVFPLSHQKIECTDSDSVRRALNEVSPGIVINCAAFVRVDESEDRPEEAFRVNTLGALCVARACAEIGAVCAYISTDYVFAGEKREPYTEEDMPCPRNIYGASKLAGEYLVQQACPRWLIVRVASLFGKAGARGKGGNFIETILAKAKAGETLRVADDILMSPTYTCDAAVALERLLSRGILGLFHIANKGACTWFEFARKVLDLTGLEVKVEPIAFAGFHLKASRPVNSALATAKLDHLSEGNLRPWHEALKVYLVEKGHIPV
ncbi:MAG: dTDP-4-dehydrorhamnose reductase [Nitrososphaerales archaeon]